MQYKEIPVNMVKPNPIQPAYRTEEKYVQALRKSINEIGLQEPISVVDKGSHYELINGGRRHKCFILDSRPMIPAVVHSSFGTDSMVSFIACNNPANVKQIRKKDYVGMYMKGAPIPKAIMNDLIDITDKLGKSYLEKMAKENIMTGTVMACIVCCEKIGINSRKEILEFIKWGINTKSVFYIKAFMKHINAGGDEGTVAKKVKKAFESNEPLRVTLE